MTNYHIGQRRRLMLRSSRISHTVHRQKLGFDIEAVGKVLGLGLGLVSVVTYV